MPKISFHNFSTQKRRPCTFGQSLGRPIVRSISHFFGRPKKNCLVSETGQKKFGQSLKFFWPVSLLEGEQKSQRLAKKKSETDQKFPETRQFFFGRPKKMRKRPDNWSTKRLTKTTWTGLVVPSMWFWSDSWSTNCPVFFSFFLVNQKKFVQSQGIFGQSLIFFGKALIFFFSLV